MSEALSDIGNGIDDDIRSLLAYAADYGDFRAREANQANLGGLEPAAAREESWQILEQQALLLNARLHNLRADLEAQEDPARERPGRG